MREKTHYLTQGGARGGIGPRQLIVISLKIIKMVSETKLNLPILTLSKKWYLLILACKICFANYDNISR